MQVVVDYKNPQDEKYIEELNLIEAGMEATDPESTIGKCDAVLEKTQLSSPRALYLKGLSLNRLAHIKKSNQILERSIDTLYKILSMPQVPNNIFEKSSDKCIELMIFRGFQKLAIKAQELVVQRFPTDVAQLNKLGMLNLMTGDNDAAKEIFLKVLDLDSFDGYALGHLGFVLKLEGTDSKSKLSKLEQVKKLERGVKFLKEGISSGSPELIDGKFFFHLADGLRRLGRFDDADQVYKDGTKRGVFLSFWQRSLYNVQGLKSQPIWTMPETTIEKQLMQVKKSWQSILKEAEELFNDNMFTPEGESLRDTGYWAQFELYRQGRKNPPNCKRAPITCSLIDAIPEIANNRRGQVKFSVMESGTHVHPHSGPTNCRLRAHLGLKIPPSDDNSTKLRVADKVLHWSDGEMFIFDDSFDHEVWMENPSKEPRLVLIMDLWHPELTVEQRNSLPAI